ncbi:MAG: type III pantothenate kinase [Candidatus Firestonebacteria bacterium]|nr:type III pantothenate kinase [Candidatus Firestonebacteria bacterium]
MYHKKIYLNIGNSFTVAGCFRKNSFVPLLRVPSKEVFLKKIPFLKEKNCGSVVIASVVPALEKAALKILKKRAFVLRNKNVPVLNLYENKNSVGVDRLLVSLGAYKKYGGPCIVVDFGTATTINVITKNREFKGGVICPGASLFSKYLFENTSKLPYVKIAPVKRAVGRNTKECIRAGIYIGYIEMISGLLRRVKKETAGKTKIVATGGWGKVFFSNIKEISSYEPFLVFYGMADASNEE